MAIRLCVGGGRSRLIRQFLTESLLLAAGGAALGFVLAMWGTGAIMALFATLEAPVQLDVAPNARVFAFTAAIALVTGILFGLLPALKSTRVDLTPALKDGAAQPGTPRRWITGNVLVVSQLALGVIVIAVAGLLARSLYNLKTLDAGFNGDRVLVFTLDSYGTTLDSAARSAVYADVLSRLRHAAGRHSRRGVAIGAGAHQRERTIARPARLARNVDGPLGVHQHDHARVLRYLRYPDAARP